MNRPQLLRALAAGWTVRDGGQPTGLVCDPTIEVRPPEGVDARPGRVPRGMLHEMWRGGLLRKFRGYDGVRWALSEKGAGEAAE